MGEFLKRFWAAAVSLAALVGAYLAAVAIHLAWVFWIVVGGGAAVAGLVVFLPRVIEAANHLRNYPILLKRIGELESEAEQWRNQLAEGRRTADEQWRDGIREGRAQFIGATLAAMADPVTIAGVATRNEKALIVGRVDGSKKPTNGSRYYIESTLLGDTLGVVEVRAYDEDRKILFLECIESQVPEFWARLVETARIDQTPPPGIVLRPYTLRVELATSVAAPITNVPE